MTSLVILAASVITVEAITRKRGNGGAIQKMLTSTIQLRYQSQKVLTTANAFNKELDKEPIKEPNG